MKYITIALAKGRLAKQTLALLEQTGITCEELKDKETRKLIFVNKELGLKFFFPKHRMSQLMSNTEPLISVLSAAIRLWKRDVKYWRYSTSVSAAVICVSPVLPLHPSCYIIIRSSVWLQNIRILPKISFTTKSIKP